MSSHHTTVNPMPRRRHRWVVSVLVPLALTPVACATDSGTASSQPASTDVPSSTTTTPRPERLDVVATEYGWSGMPEHLPPGSYPLTLRNDGAEAHEIQVFENLDGLELDELFDMGPADMEAHVQSAGGAIVGPGATSEATTLELEEGTYEVVCFIPATTDGRPHFEHGMHQTLAVG